MKQILIAIFLLTMLGTLANAATERPAVGTSDAAWPEPGNPIPPYDK